MAGYEFMTATGHTVVADFRSDTVTRATPQMREAMARAQVGDDVFGEDPTVNQLQETVAALTGKETALWMTTATEANLVALMAHCGRGDEFIVGTQYHVYTDEAGGASALGGAVACPLPVEARGSLSSGQIRAAVKADDVHYPITRLLSLENTVHGEVQPKALIDELGSTALGLGLAVHLDGARLFNAAVATGEPVKAFLDHVDTVTLCMSKGLGAPQGALLAGSAATIHQARRLRKMVGGGARQVGHLAAAALHALDHHVERLADDHANAEQLAEGLEELDGVGARAATNMVFASVDTDRQQPLLEHLAAQGMAVSGFSPHLRLVCHLDVNSSDVDLLIKSFAGFSW